MLTKTFKKYIGETKKLLRFFGLDHPYLAEYREDKNPLRRNPKLRPKKKIYARSNGARFNEYAKSLAWTHGRKMII